MNKPSRFLNHKSIQSNVYLLPNFPTIEIESQHLLSKPLARFEGFNLHVGLNLKGNKEIFAISSQAQNNDNWKGRVKKAFSFFSECLWEGTITVSRVKYSISIYKKKGCLLTEYLNFMGKLSTKKLLFIFLLMIEMVEKMHKAKINFSSLDLRFLQFVQSPQKQIQMCVCLPQMTELQSQLQKRRQQKIGSLELENRKSSKPKILLPKCAQPPKNPNRNDIQLIFQKFIQLEKQNRQEQKQEGQLQSFIKSLICFINKDKDSKIGLNERIIGFTSDWLEKMNFHRGDLQKQFLDIFYQIKSANYQNLNNFSQELKGRKGSGPFSSEEMFSQKTQQCDQMFEKVKSHTLIPRESMKGIIFCK